MVDSVNQYFPRSSSFIPSLIVPSHCALLTISVEITQSSWTYFSYHVNIVLFIVEDEEEEEGEKGEEEEEEEEEGVFQ